MTSPNPNVLLSAREVLSLRHAPSMFLLAMGAGAVNAGAFAVCERFVTHVTGTATRIGIDVGQWTLMLEYSAVLLAFIAGAMASVLAIQGRTSTSRDLRKAIDQIGANKIAGTVLFER